MWRIHWKMECSVFTVHDADVHLMSVCGIQYGKLQILRRQNLTDAEIKERYSPRREKEELRCT